MTHAWQKLDALEKRQAELLPFVREWKVNSKVLSELSKEISDTEELKLRESLGQSTALIEETLPLGVAPTPSIEQPQNILTQEVPKKKTIDEWVDSVPLDRYGILNREQIREFLILYNQGMADGEIAEHKKVKAPLSSIFRLRKKVLCIPPNQGKSGMLDVDHKMVWSEMSEEERNVAVERLNKEGLMDFEASEALHCSQGTFHARRTKLGIAPARYSMSRKKKDTAPKQSNGQHPVVLENARYKSIL